MAILTDQQLAFLRRRIAPEVPVDFVKDTVNDALQAVENWFTDSAVQSALNSAINTATSPVTLTIAQKRAVVKYWLISRFDRGN